MLIQIHILQNYAPSNLNRDDTGSPKDAMFGGYRRGRISSQCLKRNIRLSETFKNNFEKSGLIAFRTQRMPFEVSKELKTLGASDDEIQAIVARLTKFGKSSKGDKEESDANIEEVADETGEAKDEKLNAQEHDGKVAETKQLIFLSRGEIRPLAEKILALYRKYGAKKWADKKTKIEDIEKELGASVPRSVDIAMFGRMTTSKAFENVQAAVQVAHAISTNAVTQEFDYYTAMDDLKPNSEPGADMIGDVEFNSSTYYKYINIHWKGLLDNLGGEEAREVACRAVSALLEAAVFAQPTGKQNSFAAQNLPDFVMVEVSEKNVPVSYANAFLKPIYPKRDKTVIELSIDTLGEYVGKIGSTFGLAGKRAYIATDKNKLEGMTKKDSLADLQAWVTEQIGC